MIQSLEIKNYAIIEKLNLAFADGLTIITGETGAGKSILLGALGLVMGRRADNKSLFLKDKKCVVEAIFQVDKYNIRDFFAQHELDYEPELVVRREIAPTGKSRAFVNDTPVKLKVLQQLSGSLIDLHQQFDTLDIHEVSFQLRMVDALAGHKKVLTTYQTVYKKYQQQQAELKQLREKQAQAAREVEFLDFQLKEFITVEPQPGEQLSLEGEQKRLNGSEDIKNSLGQVIHALSEGELAIIGQLEALGIQIRGLKSLHPNLTKLSERFDGIELELQDLSAEFEQLIDATEYNPERIAEINTRLDSIYKLQQKHRVNSMDDLMALWEKLQADRDSYEQTDSTIEQLEKEEGALHAELTKYAKKLRQQRKKITAPFEKKVVKLLGQLGMDYAQIKIAISELETFGPSGLDRIEFLFAPNKGSEFQAIKEVASGGELSRLTLAIKSLVADAIPLPTLIFDEIDTGISGDVALKMGKILHELSLRHQVVSITHTPQIAVQADRHYFVYKTPEADRTITQVRELAGEERIAEVATMLSGSPPSTSAIENAKELLGA